MAEGFERKVSSFEQVLARRQKRPISFEVEGFVPPHSIDAERAVLGSILTDQRALPRIIDILEPSAFYNTAHRTIYEAMLSMFERNVPIDMVSLVEELRRLGVLEQVGGATYIAELSTQVATAANVEHYARIVQEYDLKRRLLEVARDILQRAADPSSDALEDIDRAEAEIFRIAEKRLGRNYHSMKQLARDTFELLLQLSDREQHPEGLTGVPTGYTKLDELLGGFQKSDLIIIAARPSMGKTALALSIARNVAVDLNIPVGFFSLEMSATQLVMRLLSAEVKISAHHLRTGRIPDEMMPEITRHIGILAEAPIYIDDSAALSIMELRAKARRLKAEKDVGIIFVDYLQLLHGPRAESREREISMISRSLKHIAKELNIPVVALSQLNRSVESRADKRPLLSDLRESGSIEQDADVVIFVYRPEYYEFATYDDGTPTEGTAEIIIGKQRNGPVGSVRLAFLKEYARFENLAFQYDEPPELSTPADDFDIPSF